MPSRHVGGKSTAQPRFALDMLQLHPVYTRLMVSNA